VTCFCHQQLVAVTHHVSSKFIFHRTASQHIGRALFSDFNISQGSVVTPVRHGGIFNKISYCLYQCKECENRSIFGEVMVKSSVSCFLTLGV